MRSISTDNQTALASARSGGLAPRQFFWITVKDRDTGDPTDVGLWTGDGEITLDVISGQTGESESRTYTGGVNLVVGDIPQVSDLTIQTVEVVFSAIADICQTIVRGYDPRLAKVEIHAGWIDKATREFADPPEIDFLGEVDGAPITTASVGQESTVALKLVSDAISMLTRKNPRKRSYEGQKRRSGDEFNLYANVVGAWHIYWGEPKASAGTPLGGGIGGGR